LTLSRHARKRAEGTCGRCPRPYWRAGMCFRCYVWKEFTTRKMSSYAKRAMGKFNVFMVGLAARYERILHEEGFAVEAVKEPAYLIDKAGFDWARGRLRRKLLEIVAKVDDVAIRERFKVKK